MKTMIRMTLAVLGCLVVAAAWLAIIEAPSRIVVAADQPEPIPHLPLAATAAQSPPPAPRQKMQIMLHTTILDFDREKLAKMGIGMPENLLGGTTKSDDGAAGDSPNSCSIVSAREAKRLTQFLTTSGAGRILANPTIVTIDGRPASFRSGGEFPLIVPQSTGTTSIEYRQFGTSIDFVPIHQASGKLRLEIRVEQSEVDHSKSVDVSGTAIPRLRSRRIDAAVELEPGQTAVFANSHGEQMLVLVTPELVEPISAVELQNDVATAANQPQPEPSQLARPLPRRADPPFVTLSAVVYKFDPQRLEAEGLEIRKTLTSSPGAVVTAPSGKTAQSVVTVISPRTAAALTRRLTATDAVTLLSRPQVRTVSGSPARVEVGSKKRLPGSAGQVHKLGIELDLVPVIKEDRIRLEVRARHSHVARGALETVDLSGAADLYAGEVLSVCQNTDQNEQLLVFVTPVGFGPAGSAPSPLTPHRQLPAGQPHIPLGAPASTLNRRAQNPAAADPSVENDRRVAQLRQAVERLMPDARIELYALPQSVVISGRVSDRQQIEVLTSVARNYFGDVINNLTVSGPEATSARSSSSPSIDLENVLKRLFPGDNIKTYPLKSSILLSGTARPDRIDQAIRVAEDYYPNVINNMTATDDPQQGRLPEARSAQAAAPRSDTIHTEIRELRDDVKMLRRDVSRLIELLEKRGQESASRTQSTADRPPTMAEPHSDVDAWQVIGLRVVPGEVQGSRYRGGLKITEVRPGSPAEKAEIRPGDVLVGLGKWESVKRENLDYVLKHSARSGETSLKFYVLRAGETLFGHLELAPRPPAAIEPEMTETDRLTPDESKTYWDVTLDDIIRIGLQNSKAVRNVGALPPGADGKLGVVLARVNKDISLSDFSDATRDWISDAEQAYGQLWQAYRNVAGAKSATDSARTLWAATHGRKEQGDVSTQAEAETRELYFQFRAQMDESLESLHASEQRLRSLLGLSSDDGRLIRPTDPQ